MSEAVKAAIEARERRTNGLPEKDDYRELQKAAKAAGVPANQSKEDLETAIAAAAKDEDGAEG